MTRSPSLIPDPSAAGAVHMVLDDLGLLGRVWRELDEEQTDEHDIVRAILDTQFARPIKVVAFKVEEGWARDVTEGIARAVIELARSENAKLSRSTAAFVECATGSEVPDDVAGTS